MRSTIDVIEVSPRDGLQNEKTPVSTRDKIELIHRLAAAGVHRMEVTSFVNPDRVPQLADADAVMAAVRDIPELSTIGLVFNRRGLERAIASGISEINVIIVASETFSRRNQGASIRESIDRWKDLAPAAIKAGLKPSVTIAAAFGCPFEGAIAPEAVAEIAREASQSGPVEIALADTIGVAAPNDIVAVATLVKRAAPGFRLRGHFHNTRNTGMANAYAAVMSGFSALDSSLGGIGGCPFAPAATGNIATEDLVYMLRRMDIDSGIALEKLVNHAPWLEQKLGHPIPGMLSKAGLFPSTGQASAR